MRIKMLHVTPLLLAASAAVVIAAAPAAMAAVPAASGTQISCTGTELATQCSSPGNSQITAKPPQIQQAPAYPFSLERR